MAGGVSRRCGEQVSPGCSGSCRAQALLFVWAGHQEGRSFAKNRPRDVYLVVSPVAAVAHPALHVRVCMCVPAGVLGSDCGHFGTEDHTFWGHLLNFPLHVLCDLPCVLSQGRDHPILQTIGHTEGSERAHATQRFVGDLPQGIAKANAQSTHQESLALTDASPRPSQGVVHEPVSQHPSPTAPS